MAQTPEEVLFEEAGAGAQAIPAEQVPTPAIPTEPLPVPATDQMSPTHTGSGAVEMPDVPEVGNAARSSDALKNEMEMALCNNTLN